MDLAELSLPQLKAHALHWHTQRDSDNPIIAIQARHRWDEARIELRRRERELAEQPEPKPNELPAVWDLVMADMRARDAKGVATYRTRLQPHNGRDALRDAYEEALDLAAYLRQAIYERDGK